MIWSIGCVNLTILALATAEEESLVLFDRAADLEAVLVQFDFGFLRALRVGEEVVRVERVLRRNWKTVP